MKNEFCVAALVKREILVFQAHEVINTSLQIVMSLRRYSGRVTTLCYWSITTIKFHASFYHFITFAVLDLNLAVSLTRNWFTEGYKIRKGLFLLR